MRRDAGMVVMFSMLCIGILFSQKYFFFVSVCVMNLTTEERKSSGKKEKSGAGDNFCTYIVQQGGIYPQRE